MTNWTFDGVQDDSTKPSWGLNMQVSNDQMLFQRAAAGVNTLVPFMAIKGSGNVGIGTTAPTQKLEVSGGGVRINADNAPKPSCDSSIRGTFWFGPGGTGAKDSAEVCAKDASDGYAWRTLW